MNNLIKPGHYWFEYHCWESPKSQDAELWYRSHQKIEVLGLSPNHEKCGLEMTRNERMEEGVPLTYEIRFADGFEGTAFEDEILESPEEFTAKQGNKP